MKFKFLVSKGFFLFISQASSSSMQMLAVD